MIKNIDLQNDCLNLTSTNNIHVCFLFASASAVGPGLKVLCIEKRYASVVYSKRTYLIRSTYQASVQCDFIPLKSFELYKPF